MHAILCARRRPVTLPLAPQMMQENKVQASPRSDSGLRDAPSIILVPAIAFFVSGLGGKGRRMGENGGEGERSADEAMV
ncbi:hypothetical protein NMY22_g11170 [Coprinellus aureogranulatus]|nr:hypothetical protein NMY22_g11170 [Coprinellus aureogranulatus]